VFIFFRQRRLVKIDATKRDAYDKNLLEMATKFMTIYGEKKTKLFKALSADSYTESYGKGEVDILVALIQNVEFCNNASNLKGF